MSLKPKGLSDWLLFGVGAILPFFVVAWLHSTLLRESACQSVFDPGSWPNPERAPSVEVRIALVNRRIIVRPALDVGCACHIFAFGQTGLQTLDGLLSYRWLAKAADC